MLIFKDSISGAELFTDSYFDVPGKYKNNGTFIIIRGDDRMQGQEEFVLAGSNPSAEEEVEQQAAEECARVCDVSEDNHLQKVERELFWEKKKDLSIRLKSFFKAALGNEELTSTKEWDADAFKKDAVVFGKFCTDHWANIEWYFGEGDETPFEGLPIPAVWGEDLVKCEEFADLDESKKYFFFFKSVLLTEKQ